MSSRKKFDALLDAASQTVKAQGGVDKRDALVALSDVEGEGKYFSRSDKLIEISLIDPSPYQPRQKIDISKLDGLALSISTDMLHEPIRVRQKECGRYELIDGHRRLEAAKSIGWQEIPAFVKAATDVNAAKAALIINIQREEFSAYEIGVAMKKLIDDGHVKTKVELVNVTGLDRNTVGRCLRMAEMNDELAEIMTRHPAALGANAGELLTDLSEESPGLAKEALEKIVSGQLKESHLLQWYQQRKAGSDKAVIQSKSRTVREDAFIKATLKPSAGGGFSIQVKPAPGVDPVALQAALEKSLESLAFEL